MMALQAGVTAEAGRACGPPGRDARESEPTADRADPHDGYRRNVAIMSREPCAARSPLGGLRRSRPRMQAYCAGGVAGAGSAGAGVSGAAGGGVVLLAGDSLPDFPITQSNQPGSPHLQLCLWL